MPINLTALDFEWPQSAPVLASLAKVDINVSQLIMAGIANVGSWLIENRILDSIREKGIPEFEFCFRDTDNRTAALLLLPDGSAFARNPLGSWFALEAHDALSEIVYIGSRYASGNHWIQGFEAKLLHRPRNEKSPISPLALAAKWTEATGVQPNGYSECLSDHVEAFGLNVIDNVFHTKGRLGL
jgi:hypothetical protein